MTEVRFLVHFDSERVSVYRFQSGELKLLKRERLAFGDSLTGEVLADRVGEFCAGLKEFSEVVDNKGTRLYATGVFHQLPQPEVATLVNSVYVDTGLYVNIVGTELEQFYLETGMSVCDFSATKIRKGPSPVRDAEPIDIVRDRLREIVASVLEVEKEDIESGALLYEELGISSLEKVAIADAGAHNAAARPPTAVDDSATRPGNSRQPVPNAPAPWSRAGIRYA
ncbi:acyl carrier protein [Streptomyces sp. NPDC059832]|uniref:acyl carrier protein n=1 Tax=unclassified Streptomyces TaxID=2593676 RepID=UPI003651B5BD